MEQFPNKISRFIEPFTGGGSVFLNVDAEYYILNDIDKYIINLHKFLIKSAKNSQNFFSNIEKTLKKYNLSRSYLEDIIPIDMKKKYVKTYYAKFNKEGYLKLRQDFNNSKKKNYLYLYILLILGFNRILRFNNNGEYNLPVGNVDFNLNTVNALRNYFEIVKEDPFLFNDLKKFVT